MSARDRQPRRPMLNDLVARLEGGRASRRPRIARRPGRDLNQARVCAAHDARFSGRVGHPNHELRLPGVA